MANTFDCIVIGCGGFGSSTLHHLAARGAKVLGIERFRPIHDRGSSHGETRAIRKAYFEHADYVPLLQDAFLLWRQLEAESEMTLLNECGLFITGPPNGPAVSGAKRAAEQHALPIETIPAIDQPREYAGVLIPADFEIVVEKEAGYLLVNVAAKRVCWSRHHTEPLCIPKKRLSTGGQMEHRPQTKVNILPGA